ncbi:MAG TPA: efflux RND transporter periplasmic adaptor subunit [Candidatus Cloacimonadota bacterium]|nr:efflux RND transporter periplasmic adaptor subunit [Candidatus Cloacimonadota bacterium]HPS38768.1 efflux RND transporter periplasmic adaptor subunit [Candidatus Cloacimonadota bacterium]
MRSTRIIIPVLSALLLFSACAKGKKEQFKGKDEKQPVTVEELSLRGLDDYISVSGKLTGITDITMSSETSGRIMQVYKKLGDYVKQGERIGRVDNDVYQYRYDQSEAALGSAQAAFDNAQKNLNYAEESLKRGLISTAEYNTALSAYKGAKAGLDGARAGLESSRSGVNGSYFTAPASGMISNLNITQGQFIAAGAPVASITDASTLIIKTGVGESQISRIKKGQAVEVTYPGLSEKLSGRVRGFGIRPLTGSSAYPVEIELSNPKSLLPGMVVSAKILSEHYSDLLYTDITNISKEYGKNYAYVIDQQNKAEKREVVLGQVIGEYVVITSGLEVGDKIVTSGAENLEEGSLVEIRK